MQTCETILLGWIGVMVGGSGSQVTMKKDATARIEFAVERHPCAERHQYTAMADTLIIERVSRPLLKMEKSIAWSNVDRAR